MAIDLSLDRIKALLEHIPYTRKTIHIAGTNGKGSVSTLIEHALSASGLAVGKFTSPHLVYVRDCIAIKQRPLSEEVYSRLAQHVQELSDTYKIGASSFELLTATALAAFEEAQLDAVVVEVGMGGRLDATNAILDERILLSVITAIDLDHQAFLGSTIREIATEKAGIIRPNTVVVLGEQAPENDKEVLEAVRAVALQKDASLCRPSPPAEEIREVSTKTESHTHQYVYLNPWPVDKKLSKTPLVVCLQLLGEHQRSNARLAYTVLHLLQSLAFPHLTMDHVKRGFEEARWPGRLSWHTIKLDAPLSVSSGSPAGHESPRELKVLVDGAHNAASARTLAAYLASASFSSSSSSSSPSRTGDTPYPRSPLTFILGLSHSPPKTPLSVLAPLLRHGDRVALVPFSEPVDGMPWVHNVPETELLSAVRELIGDGAQVLLPSEGETQKTSAEKIREAMEWARGFGEVAVFAGSLYLVGDLYRLIGTQE